MKKGYIIVKTDQGLSMCQLSKAVDQLCERMENLSIFRPDLGIADVSLQVFEFCDEASLTLHEIAEMFELQEGCNNSGYYRSVIRDSRYGKRRRCNMKTYCGAKLFKTTVSVDRMCTVIGMLAREQRIPKDQARKFYEKINTITGGLRRTRDDLGKILKNAESGSTVTV